MENAIVSVLISLYLMAPIVVHAESALKGPLSYSLADYGLILGAALLGGFARWWAAVRRGDVASTSFAGLIGELATSALCGLVTWWMCEGFGLNPLYSAAAAGLGGHSGAQGLAWLERIAKRRAEKVLGIQPTEPAPLEQK